MESIVETLACPCMFDCPASMKTFSGPAGAGLAVATISPVSITIVVSLTVRFLVLKEKVRFQRTRAKGEKVSAFASDQVEDERRTGFPVVGVGAIDYRGRGGPEIDQSRGEASAGVGAVVETAPGTSNLGTALSVCDDDSTAGRSSW